MAITEYNYTPEYTRLGVNNKPKDVITASYWNGLFNSLSHQGDHTAEELGNVLNHFTAVINEVKGIADDKYVKPTDGIPKTDLAADVQTSLSKADTAIQTHQSLAAYRTAFAQDVIDSDLGDRIEVIEGKEASWDAKSDFSGSYNDLTNKPTIPAPVTEQTVSGWGFTKNTGTYSKPTGGIPKTDLTSTVQTSLDKADSALQSHQSLAAYRTAFAQDIIDSDLGDRISVIEGKESAWDSKSDFSGSYNDLTDKPTIPAEVTPLIGTTSALTPAQVSDAVTEGTPVVVQYTDRTYGVLYFTAFNIAESFAIIVSQTIVYANGGYILAELIGNKSNNIWSAMFTTLAQKTDIPSSLKNPNALTIKIGSTTVTYDGSAAKTVTIADGTEVEY